MRKLCLVFTIFVSLVFGLFAKAPIELNYDWVEVPELSENLNFQHVWKNSEDVLFVHNSTFNNWWIVIVDTDGTKYEYVGEYKDVKNIQWHIIEKQNDNFEEEFEKIDK